MMEIIKNDKANQLKHKKEKGASLVEYALLVALIAVVAIAAVTLLGDKVSGTFSNIADQLD